MNIKRYLLCILETFFGPWEYDIRLKTLEKPVAEKGDEVTMTCYDGHKLLGKVVQVRWNYIYINYDKTRNG